MVVVVGVVVIHVVAVAATPLCFFELFAALVRLLAILAVAVHRVAQLVLCLVNTSFTFFMSVVSVVRRAGRDEPTKQTVVRTAMQNILMMRVMSSP